MAENKKRMYEKRINDEAKGKHMKRVEHIQKEKV